MNNEFGADLITLIDDEGVEHEFEILDEIDNDDGVFYALLPTFDDPQSELESEGTYYIFEVIEEDGEEQLAEVEDDELLDKLAAIFAGIRGILSSTEITSCLVRGLLHQ